MKQFYGEDFLIKNETGLQLYQSYAKNLPIYDYHCHLSAQEIADDHVYFDIGELLLKCDHYKWRLMRMCGIDENLITGNAPYKEKFLAYAKTLSSVFGNPVYQWTHMELKRYFGINEPLNETNALSIYERANRMMADGSFSARRLITQSNVFLIATTDDPCDDLRWHRAIQNDEGFTTKVVPTFRPDLACDISKYTFVSYVQTLGKVAKKEISSFETFLVVLKERIDFFETLGCKIADHGIENIPLHLGSQEEAKAIFDTRLNGKPVSLVQAEQFLFFMLTFFAKEYTNRNWAMQIHMSVIRNQNSKLFDLLGPNIGTDSSGDVSSANALGILFDAIERDDGMPKTILYSLNPTSNYVLSSMLGNFAGGMPGKMQLGAAWWFCDHRDGIVEQLRLLASTGALGQFVGMLTDSRSFISYARHDYFRRILCNLIGNWAEAGEIPSDVETLGSFVANICFYNAKKYFEM